MQAQRFNRRQRIRRHAEFQHVFSAGSRYHGRYLTLVIAPTRTPSTRLGLVASRKVGNAVVRNRAKRLIREVFRRHVQREGSATIDLVVIPRREFFDADFVALQQDFAATLRRSRTQNQRDGR